MDSINWIVNIFSSFINVHENISFVTPKPVPHQSITFPVSTEIDIHKHINNTKKTCTKRDEKGNRKIRIHPSRSREKKHQQKIPFSCLPHRKGFFHCRQIPPLVNCHQCMRTKRWVNMEKGWAYRPQPKFRWKKGYFADGWVAWWELVVWIWHSFHGEIHGRCWWIEPRVQMIFKGSWCRRKGYLHTRPLFSSADRRVFCRFPATNSPPSLFVRICIYHFFPSRAQDCPAAIRSCH